MKKHFILSNVPGTILPILALAFWAHPMAAPAQTTSTVPDAPVPNYHIQYNGLIDGYYLYQFQNPKGVTSLTGRVYDVRQNTPTLALAELNVFQNARPKRVGFKATLVAGDAADINHFDFGGASHGRGEARFKTIQQLYGSYSFGANGGGIDAGKIMTPFGYEELEATGNNNYSHSIAFGLEPTYHLGLRAYTPATAFGVNGLVATAYIVNTLYNTSTAGVQDDNGQPAYIAQLTYTDPKGKLGVTGTLGLAKDKFDFIAFARSDANSREILNDEVVTYTLNASASVGLNYTYGKFNPNSGGQQSFNALGLYYHQSLTPKTGFSLRYSSADIKNSGAAMDQTPSEITATYQIKTTANFMTFFELRHDMTNVPNSYYDSNTQLTKKTQDTVTIAGAFSF